jgi:hypothetical protein
MASDRSADHRPALPGPLGAPDEQADPSRVAELPLEHRSSTKSRLLRMKEKGLFRNG